MEKQSNLRQMPKSYCTSFIELRTELEMISIIAKSRLSIAY